MYGVYTETPINYNQYFMCYGFSVYLYGNTNFDKKKKKPSTLIEMYRLFFLNVFTKSPKKKMSRAYI